MHPFLEAVTERIMARNSSLENQIVVLPTKRAGSFLRRLLAARLEGESWLPEIITPNDLATRISGLEPAEKILQTFSLYNAYSRVLKGDAYSLSEFMSWSDILLSDFNDIDAYLLNPKAVFKELADYNELEHFSFLESELSEKQIAFRKFWQMLPEIFQAFKKDLASRGVGTSGNIMRLASERVDDYLEERKSIFLTIAGFSALSNSELRLYGKIEKAGRGEVLYDFDPACKSDFTNAGIFIERNLKQGVGEVLKPSKSLAERKSEVTVVSAVNKLDQANAVTSLLTEDDGLDKENTCLVLADESMLIPFIERLPSKIENVNVTMGVRLKDFSFYDWFDIWFELRRIVIRENGAIFFLKERVKRFSEHPFSILLGLSIPFSENQNLIPSGTFGKHPLIELLFHPFGEKPGVDGKSLKDLFLTLIEELSKCDIKHPEVRAAIFGCEKLIDLANKLAQFELSAELTWSDWHRMCRHTLSTAKLSLIGEPMTGLQIMGVLETRALGFSNIILVSADEGNFPKTNVVESFIPFEIRSFHQLPGKREKEAVYAYQFYRLLSHADRFRAIYHTDAGTFSGGEMSRYLRQIENESPNWPGCSFKKRHLEHSGAGRRTEAKDLQKTDKMLEEIKKRLIQKGLSVSSINRYYDSPLEWYYEYGLGLREPKEDEIDASVFGSVVHRALENLYSPLAGQVLSVENLEELRSQIEIHVSRAFQEFAPGEDLRYGMNRIHFETAEKMITAFLYTQTSELKSGSQIRYIEGEREVKRSLDLEVGGETITIPFQGFIDRIEERAGSIRLIDFKSGKVESKDLKLTFKDVDTPAADYAKKLKNSPKGLQLLMYEWLAQDEFGSKDLKSQIVSLTQPGKEDLVLVRKFGDERDFEFLEEFLKTTISEILNPTVPFAHSEDFKYAKFG